MTGRLGTWLIGLATLFLATACEPRQTPEARPVTVFAAASLTDALQVVADLYEADGGSPVRLSFASSGAVARQIDAGAPADVVVLADPVWMDRLASGGRIVADSRAPLLRNRLVVIAPADSPSATDPFEALRRGGGRLAIGDPESVPAGAYAREWLQATGRWAGIEDHVVMAADVRAVRAFVARGEASLGVVYRSDALGATDVRVVQVPPDDQQPDIVYPAALVGGGPGDGAAFLAFLKSPEASDVFRRFGFDPYQGAGQ